MKTEVLVKIPPTKTGVDFLSSSHFNIGNDPKWMAKKEQPRYKSTFQHDYPSQFQKKTMLANIPPPAFIMHKDNQIHNQCSVTREQFVPKSLADHNFLYNSLAKTNFKMDRDDRIETFQTTQEAYYGAKQLNSANKSSQMLDPMRSHIPQGDAGKESCPDSSYRSSFVKKDTIPFERFSKTGNPVHLTVNTIQGDSRSHGCNDMFNTTSRMVFPVHVGQGKPLVPDSIKYPETEIPCGKKIALESTHQGAFNAKMISDTQTFDRTTALSKLQRTTFKNGDDRLHYFYTTTDDCYTFKMLPKMDHTINQVTNRRNGGHQHLIRSVQPITVSINRKDFQTPQHKYSHHIVDGSDLHTVSKISFGNDLKSYYKTTMDSSFPIKKSSYHKTDANTCYSSIPFKFYDDLSSNSSYRLDYSATNGVKKLQPNPAALENLIKSHIVDPIHNFRQFKSTHAATYTFKGQARKLHVDAGRLQRSSVPIGTLLCS